MTVLFDSAGPGNSNWLSSKFQASIGNSPLYVYGYARDAYMATLAWAKNQVVEQSWASIQADETVTVSISLRSGAPVTSAVLYPKDSGASYSISSGVLRVVIPQNTRLRIEVNGDRAEVFSLFSSPVTTVPTNRVDYSTLLRAVSSVDVGNNWLVIPSHGFAEDERVVLHSDGSMPSVAGEALTKYRGLRVSVVDVNTVQLLDEDSNPLTLDGAGSGTMTMAPGTWTNTGQSLYFGPGEHALGKLFDVGDNTNVYFDFGAVVIGSFDMRQVDGAVFAGPGNLSGTFNNRDNFDGNDFPNSQDNIMFWGNDGLKFTADNRVDGLTIFAMPYFSGLNAIGTWTNCHIISCWTWNSDGFKVSPRNSWDPWGRVVDCYAFCGDDCIAIHAVHGNVLVQGTFAICTNNTCFLGHGLFIANEDYHAEVVDCHAMHLMGNDTGIGAAPKFDARLILRSYMDGAIEHEDQRSYNNIIRNLKVWGECAVRLWSIGNYPHPFGSGREQYGQHAFWEFDGVWVEQTPQNISTFWAKDSVNTPHDFTFTNIEIGGVKVTAANFTDFFQLSPEIYNFIWEGSNLLISSSPVYEGGFMLSELEAINTMLTTIGQSPVNSITGAVNQDVATAKHILKEARMQTLVRGWKFNTEYNVDLLPDAADGRVRVPVEALRVDINQRELGYHDPVQRGQYLYDLKSRTYNWSRGFKVDLVVHLEWDQLPESARRYIEAKAAHTFAVRMDVDENRRRAAKENEIECLAALTNHNTDIGNYSMIGGNATSLGILTRGY